MKVEVLEHLKLKGSPSIMGAQQMYFMEKQNIRARQIAIYLENDSVEIEPGAMSYFKGNIEMVSGVTVWKCFRKSFLKYDNRRICFPT